MTRELIVDVGLLSRQRRWVEGRFQAQGTRSSLAWGLVELLDAIEAAIQENGRASLVDSQKATGKPSEL
jgi:hypothetical protein